MGKAKKLISLVLAIVICLGMVPFAAAAESGLSAEELAAIREQSRKNKANVIITNDGECDDMDSMLHYLYYANEFNTKAVIINSSTYHWTGGTIIDPKTKEPVKYDETIHGTQNVIPYEYTSPTTGETYQALRYSQSRWTGMGWYEAFYKAYEDAYPTLSQYDSSYPTADELRAVTYMGNIKYKGEMTEVTEGSTKLVEMFLNNTDGEPLYVLMWGGSNTIARALLTIEETYNPKYNKDADAAEWQRIYNKICNEVVFYMILSQDNTFDDYIRPNWPGTKFIWNSGQFWSYAYMKSSTPTEYYEASFNKAWTDTITQEGGKLGSLYLTNASGWDLRHIADDTDPANVNQETKKVVNPLYSWVNWSDTRGFYKTEQNEYNAWAADWELVKTWGESENRGNAAQHENCTSGCCRNAPSTNPSEYGYFISEGDSPSFFFLIDNGLRSNEDPTWGGWGGRFVKDETDETLWTDKGAKDWNYYGVSSGGWGGSSSTKEPGYDSNFCQTRWTLDIQQDFTARAAWAVKADGNQNPQSAVMNGLDLTAVPGQTITLNGVAMDPNGDNLSYSWWQYFEADTYDGTLDGKLVMSGNDSKNLTVTIPTDAEVGDTIHLVFEVQDDNEKPMKAYKRVIITIGSGSVSLSGVTEAKADTDSLDYTVSVDGVVNLATAEISFCADADYVGSVTAEGMNGFSVLSVKSEVVDGKLSGKAIVYKNDGLTTSEATPIVKLKLSNAGKIGEMTVSITAAKLSGYTGEDLDDNAYFSANVVKGSVTTAIGYSIYDVNCDGVVDQLDLTKTQRVYNVAEGDANWSAAKICDVNSDGIVDVSDMLLILANYSEQF